MSNIDNLEHYPMPDLEPIPQQDVIGDVSGVMEAGWRGNEWEAKNSNKSADQQVNQDSGEVEWYTPPWLIERVKRVLGDIDTDPATCSTANKVVQAKQIYTKDNNGLDKDWNGVVWMNHPYGKGEKPCVKKKSTGEYNCKKNACKKRGYHIDHEVPGNAQWVRKFVDEFMIGNCTKGACITFASTSENWFRPLYHFHQVWLYDRVAFVDKHGNEVKGTTKGSVLTFMGADKKALEREFADIGFVK